MRFIHNHTDAVSVWGFEVTPHQFIGSTYKHRVVFDLGKHSLAIEWGKRNGN